MPGILFLNIWYNLEKNEIVRKYRGPQFKLKGLKMRLSENGEDMILFGPNDVDVVKIKTYQDYFKSPYVQELAKDELESYLND